jgi:hypothetical protein
LIDFTPLDCFCSLAFLLLMVGGRLVRGGVTEVLPVLGRDGLATPPRPVARYRPELVRDSTEVMG